MRASAHTDRVKRWLTLFLCSLGVASAQGDEAANRFAQSLRLPNAAYAPAPVSPMLDLDLPDGSIRLLSLQSLPARNLKRVFTDLPTLFGGRCGEQEAILFPGTEQTMRQLSTTLLSRPQALGQLDTRFEFASRQGNVFSVLTETSSGFLLASCRLVSEKGTPAVLPTPLNVYAGPTPYIVLAETTGTVHWCGAGSAAQSLRAFGGSVSATALSNDGALLAVAGWESSPSVKIYDALARTLLGELPLRRGAAALAFTGDRTGLLVQDADGTYTLYDLASRQARQSFSTVSAVTAILQGAGTTLFSNFSSSSSPIRLFSTATGLALRNIRSYGVVDHALAPGGEWAALVTDAGQLKAYRATSRPPGQPQTDVPEVANTLGVRSEAWLYPGAAPQEVLILLAERQANESIRAELLAWDIGRNELQVVRRLELPGTDFPIVNPQARQIGAVRRCLSGELIRQF